MLRKEGAEVCKKLWFEGKKFALEAGFKGHLKGLFCKDSSALQNGVTDASQENLKVCLNRLTIESYTWQSSCLDI